MYIKNTNQVILVLDLFQQCNVNFQYRKLRILDVVIEGRDGVGKKVR